MRIWRFACACAAAALFVLPSAAADLEAQATVGPRVQIETGLIEGANLPSGARAFLGIPFAAPPVRELRWRDPRPAASWSGVLHADKFAPQCIQPLRSSLANHYSGVESVSEDCLYLNVWTRPDLRKAPVVVYIHGGAFYIGSGSMGIYGGEGVSQEGAVFVNFNYRLGPLGFLALPELSAESAHGSSGNYGLLDQIAALRWVQRNIEQFGGDPENVTIVGQSAGSMSVLMLQASPLAKGLFHRAVGMSGAMIGGPLRLPSREQAEQDGMKLQAAWKASGLEQLRALPADRLVVPRVPGGPGTGPAVDGHVLPAPLTDLFARKVQNDVPLLIGFTNDESFGGLGPVSSLAEYRDKARALFGAQTERFLQLYPASIDAEAATRAREADRDGTVAASMFAWALLQKANGNAPVFAYQFSRPHNYFAGVTFSDLDPVTAGAYHTSEVPFWLGTQDAFNRYRPTRAWTPEDRAMSGAMLHALVAFARTGKPDLAGLDWPRFAASRPQLVEFAGSPRVTSWPDRERLAFFAEFYAEPTPQPRKKK
jgi:para-nitrobenzyl esterase